MRNLVLFVQFEKREKHPCRSVTFSKVAGYQSATSVKLTLLHGYFSHWVFFTNGTKLRNASQLLSEIGFILLTVGCYSEHIILL